MPLPMQQAQVPSFQGFSGGNVPQVAPQPNAAPAQVYNRPAPTPQTHPHLARYMTERGQPMQFAPAQQQVAPHQVNPYTNPFTQFQGHQVDPNQMQQFLAPQNPDAPTQEHLTPEQVQAFQQQHFQNLLANSPINRELQTLRSQNAQSQDIIEKLRGALVPESNEDPRQARKMGVHQRIEEMKGMLDQYLEAGLKSQMAGNPIPLTVNLASVFFTRQVEAIEREEQLLDALEKLQAQVHQLSDPEAFLNRQTFLAMDQAIWNELDKLYGPMPSPEKKAMFEATAQKITAQIASLREKKPIEWDHIRRDQSKILRMVQLNVESILPPRVRQILEREHIMTTPQTDQELWAAFKEADSIPDQAQRAEVKRMIRQEILSRQGNAGRKQGKPNLTPVG